jgi:carboxyl-terminal processing protease
MISIKNIVRADEENKMVPYYGMINNEIGYIQFTTFMEHGGKEVSDALDSLKKLSNNNIKGLVLDLRNNGGGLLVEAINIVNLFTPKGITIVKTKGKLQEAQHTYSTINEAKDDKIKVAVLTNHMSASASEIVSGSLQDLDRGVIVGNKTYGKGLVQITKPIGYGNQIKVTISKYYTPSGRCIQALDYQHRAADGSAAKTADSLRKEFKTKNGRKIFDGGGIEPDIKIAETSPSLLLKTLQQKNYLFEFAVNYFKQHPTTNQTSKDFSVTNADYNLFIAFISNKQYSYTTNTEKKLQELKKLLEKENYKQTLANEIKQVEEKIKLSNKKDLEKNKTEIINELNKILAGFYFNQKGSIENSFKVDNDLNEAIKILMSDEQYNKILAAK